MSWRNLVLPIGAVAFAMVLVSACTNDFSTFEGEADASLVSETGTPDAPKSDASGTDAAIVDAGGDGNPCPQLASCLSAQTGCRQVCDQTYDTCTSKCGGNNGCRNKCRDDRDDCRSSCAKTCSNCATMACANRCL